MSYYRMHPTNLYVPPPTPTRCTTFSETTLMPLSDRRWYNLVHKCVKVDDEEDNWWASYASPLPPGLSPINYQGFLTS